MRLNLFAHFPSTHQPASVSLPFRLLLRCAGVEVILYNNSGRLNYLRDLIAKQQYASSAQARVPDGQGQSSHINNTTEYILIVICVE